MTDSSLASGLQNRFVMLVQSLAAKPRLELAETWSTAFVTRYTEPQRHYHTLAHVAVMIQCLEAHRAQITDPVAVELAIFFHDWIYEPRGTANEAESVVTFTTFAEQLGIDNGQRAKVVGLIEATVTHQVGAHVQLGDLQDLKLFLDFDLEVLRREWEEYIVYARQIRSEYAHLSERDYNVGRAKVLRSFLERQRVYFSEAFYRTKDEVARRNMKKEIELLDAPTTDGWIKE